MNNNQTPSNWEDAANQGGEKKARKPLKLSSNAQSFNPNQGGAFVPGGNSFQPQGGYQGGFQQGGYQGGYQQGGYQGGYQQGGYQGGYQQQQGG